ncbi:hypothetical protein ES703_55947 [subsurface metagenome]
MESGVIHDIVVNDQSIEVLIVETDEDCDPEELQTTADGEFGIVWKAELTLNALLADREFHHYCKEKL